jgi:hypothetical protein
MSKYDIASTMNTIMNSPEHLAVHAKRTIPEIQKTASDKTEKTIQVISKYEQCLNGLTKISEILDEVGLSKSSAFTILALDSLIKEATEKKDKSEKEDKKDKKEEKKEEKKESDEEDKDEEDDDEEDEEDEDSEDKDDIKVDWGGDEGEKEYKSVADPGSFTLDDLNREKEHHDEQEEIGDLEIPIEFKVEKTEPTFTIQDDTSIGDMKYEDPRSWFAEAAKRNGNDRVKFAESGNYGLGIVASILKDAASKMSVRTFVANNGPYDAKKNGKIFDMCKKHNDEKCKAWMVKFEKLKDSYLAAKKDKKEFDKGSLEKLVKACEKHCEKALSEKKKLSEAADKNKKAKVRNKPSPVFDDSNPKVKDDKDHFPINTIGRARNALARVNQYSKAPPWWKGTLEGLKKSVSRAVHKKYPSIKISDKAKK